jgi:hypothetical protein
MERRFQNERMKEGKKEEKSVSILRKEKSEQKTLNEYQKMKIMYYIKTYGLHSVLQISFNFVQDIFRGASQQDRACFWILTLFNEGEVLVTYFSNFKLAGQRPYVSVRYLFYTIADSSAAPIIEKY